MGISEEELPGIGRRYELSVRDRDRIVAVVHNSGSRDLFVFGANDSDARGAVNLDEDSARQLGAILSGAYYRPAFAEPLSSIIDRFILESVLVHESSPICGRSIHELQVRQRTGVSVVAIITGKSTLLDPQPSTVFGVGDLVLVVGEVDHVRNFRQMAEPAAPTTTNPENEA